MVVLALLSCGGSPEPAPAPPPVKTPPLRAPVASKTSEPRGPAVAPEPEPEAPPTRPNVPIDPPPSPSPMSVVSWAKLAEGPVKPVIATPNGGVVGTMRINEVTRFIWYERDGSERWSTVVEDYPVDAFRFARDGSLYAAGTELAADDSGTLQLRRWDVDGSFAWSKNHRIDNQHTEALSVAPTDLGAIWVLGLTRAAAGETFDPSVMFLTGFDADGNRFQDVHVAEGRMGEDLTVRAMPDDSLIVAGSFLGPKLTVAGVELENKRNETDLFVARIQPPDEVKWVIGLGGPGTDHITDVEIQGGQIYLAGSASAAPVKLGADTATGNWSGGFVASLDPKTGGKRWLKHWGALDDLGVGGGAIIGTDWRGGQLNVWVWDDQGKLAHEHQLRSQTEPHVAVTRDGQVAFGGYNPSVGKLPIGDPQVGAGTGWLAYWMPK